MSPHVCKSLSQVHYFRPLLATCQSSRVVSGFLLQRPAAQYLCAIHDKPDAISFEGLPQIIFCGIFFMAKIFFLCILALVFFVCRESIMIKEDRLRQIRLPCCLLVLFQETLLHGTPDKESPLCGG